MSLLRTRSIPSELVSIIATKERGIVGCFTYAREDNCCDGCIDRGTNDKDGDLLVWRHALPWAQISSHRIISPPVDRYRSNYGITQKQQLKRWTRVASMSDAKARRDTAINTWMCGLRQIWRVSPSLPLASLCEHHAMTRVCT